MLKKILIIDDEKDMLLLLQRIISEKTPYEATTVSNPLGVTELMDQADFDIVITDLKMAPIDGIQVLEKVKLKDPSIAVILMTAYGSIESAIEATRKGAFDYITKPFRKERILHVVEKAIQWQQLQRENSFLRAQLQEKPLFPTLIGSSPAIQRLQHQIDKVAKTSATVLITGESGTGKEVIARAIHSHSLRTDKPFIPINCSAIPEAIIESELFGHVKGAFTGAIRDKKGLVEEANQGTLFLDEIGDLSPSMQVKLLRLLQEGEFKGVGSNSIRKVDIRFLAATHQNLAERIKQGEFREDLFYRLNVIHIHVPPLRERTEDIPPLALHFLAKNTILHGKHVTGLAAETMDILLKSEWPGNVRELENTIERGIIMASGERLMPQDLSMTGEAEWDSSPDTTVQEEEIFSLPFKEAKDRLIEEFQSQYIAKALAKHGGNVSQAARESGLKRQYLHRLMRDTNVSSKTFKRPEDSE
jgi:DNA-binding NtrC family response regulator